MTRFFNTAGPCVPSDHYYIPSEQRVAEIRNLIESKLFFILHAPRQTGKTTFLHTLADNLNREGRYVAVVTNVESLQRVTDVEKGNPALLELIYRDAESQVRSEEMPPPYDSIKSSPYHALNNYLSDWTAACPRPIVLLMDEIDSLPEDLLISVLRQLRTGYLNRGDVPFIHSLALVGLRDVRDYKVRLRPDSESLGTASPFNIKARSLMLSNFTRDEVGELYAQHTEETGQVFEPGAVDQAYYWTQGQPWLVNALAQQITWDDVPDRATPITAAHVDSAKEQSSADGTLILTPWPTNFMSLASDGLSSPSWPATCFHGT